MDMWALNLGEGLGLKIIIWNYQQLDSICSPGTMRECRKRAGLGRGRSQPESRILQYLQIDQRKSKTDWKGTLLSGKGKPKLQGKVLEEGSTCPLLRRTWVQWEWRIDPWIWQREVIVLIRVGFFERIGVWVGTMSQGLEVSWECLEERLGVGNE